ncbi:MAG: hypothetical protein AB1758_35755, partial [Candidatus Eremiobacterota bacterium]
MKRLAKELALMLGPALLASLAVAWHYARRETFLGDFDLEQVFWQGHNLWTVLSTGDPILRTSFLGTPTPYTYTPTMIYFLPPLMALSSLTSPFFAHNVFFLGTLLANFGTFYALLRVGELGVRASALGAWIFVLSPAILLRCAVHLYLGAAFFLPLFFLVLYRDRTRGFRMGNWALLGLLAALMHGFHEYLGILGVMLLTIAGACNLTRLGARGSLRAAAAAGFVFALLVSPVLWMYAAQIRFEREHGIVVQRDPSESVRMSATPADYLMPSNLGPIYSRIGFLARTDRITEWFNYLGLLNLATPLVLAWWAVRRRDLWVDFWRSSPLLRCLWRELTATGLGMLLVSFGPRLKWAPEVALPLALLVENH